INGIYHPEFSELKDTGEKVQVMTFRQAQKENPELLNTYYSKFSDNANEVFTAMNTALANDGIIVHVKKGATLEQPIILRMISDNRHENVGSVIRNLVVVEENAEVKIAESFRSFGEHTAFVNTVTEISVAKSARVDYYKVQDDTDQM